MVREFLEGIPPPSRAGSKAFHMGSLLQEMRELENPLGVQHSRFPIQPGPNVADYAFEANSWADDFLRKEAHIMPAEGATASGWSQEFLDQPGFMGAGAAAADWDSHWDSLTSHIENPVGLRDKDLLAQTAGEIVDSLSDPKFAQSEFLQFMKKVSNGEEKLEPPGEAAKTTAAFGNSNWADEFVSGAAQKTTPDEDWATEFAGRPQPDLAEQWSREFTGESAEVFRSDAPVASDDFWSQLQQDWEKAAEENPSLGWLKEPPLSSSTEVNPWPAVPSVLSITDFLVW